MLTLHE